MSKQNNAECIICGKPYHMCLSCKEKQAISPWQIYTDTGKHYQVFLVVKQYIDKMISKDEALQLLSNIDISDMDSYRDNIKKILNEILEIKSTSTDKVKTTNNTNKVDNNKLIKKFK